MSTTEETEKVTSVKLTPKQVRNVDAMHREAVDLSQRCQYAQNQAKAAQEAMDSHAKRMSDLVAVLVGDTYEASDAWLTKVEGEDVVLYKHDVEEG